MRIVYRILILVAIFAGSLYYFGTNMTEKVFRIENKAMEMEDATLPYISLSVEGQEINLLHGYCSGLDELTVRESLTPLSAEQALSVIITENENVVKKLKYEVINVSDGKTVEEGAINALDNHKDYKVARITLKESLNKNTEYVFRITLITDHSKRIYYYTRVKVMDTFYLKEKLDFVQEFHAATFKKDTADVIGKYLEKPYLSPTNFAKVTINNDYDTVTYGTLEPTQIFQQLPTISEIAKDTASITLESMISVKTSTGLEYYRVKENFRFMYGAARTYLYDYTRTMESVFDVGLTSLGKSEFKIGITANPELDIVTNSDRSTIAFVRERALWSYSVAENKMTEVFSFYQDETDFIRDTFDQHDIRILNMDNDGNLDFIVYGYMNRGEYEGRVGIVLYRYNRVIQRVEEQIYIPINTTYGLLKEEIGDFCYRNEYDVFYLHIFNSIYSYNLTTKVLTEIATGVDKNSIVFSKEGKYIAYQEITDDSVPKSIEVLTLENGQKRIITVDDKPIKLLGLIDQNIIYGIANPSDIVVGMDGTKIPTMAEVYIVDQNNVIKKKYQKEGYYITDATVKKNVIELKRIVMTPGDILSYEVVESDFILNTETQNSSHIQVTKRVTDMMLTEYYISMNLTDAMSGYPKVEHTKNTVITEDRTVRINRMNGDKLNYITYAFGEIKALTTDIGTAIRYADQHSGIVLSSSGQVVWERGVKAKKSQISGIEIVGKPDGVSSLAASIKMILAYRNSAAVTDYNRQEMSVIQYLQKELTATPVKAENITLDEALYFVYKNRPVIALKKTGEAVLITGYDSTAIVVIDPVTRSEKRIVMKEATAMFDAAGNIFITYIE